MKVKLEDIGDVFSGVQITRYVDINSNEYPVIKNKFKKENILDYSMENISENINEKYFSKKGDIIISLSQPYTISLLHQEGFIIPMYFAILRVNKEYDTSYIYHYLRSKIFHKKIHTLSEGGSLKIIKIEYLRNIEIEIVDLKTQKKYGKFLNLIDKKSKLLDNKKQINEKIKEFVIQKQLNGD